MNATVNTRAASLLSSLAGRRKELQMSLRIVAERSGLGVRTVQRVLSLREPKAKLNTVLQIAGALNVELRPKEAGTAHLVRKREAVKKAARLASMVQGTSALESQAIPKNDLRDIKDDITDKLLTGSPRQLWAD
jgi:transcriptional regulator with XRE-family HTH domain